jgi:hypothetical protein
VVIGDHTFALILHEVHGDTRPVFANKIRSDCKAVP